MNSLGSLFKHAVGVLGLLAFAACSPGPSDGNSKDSVYRLPWLDASGEYTLQDILLTTFHEPDKLRGAAAEIIVNPRISGGELIGEEPIGRWIQDGSRRVPADHVTMQAAAVYAHLEKLSAIDAEVGVSKFLKGRERVGIMALISDSVGGGQSVMLNNAIYDGRLDSMFVVPYSVPVGLSIAFNGGIIGHEHFHRVFQAIVMSPIREADRNGTIPYGWDDSIIAIREAGDDHEAHARPEPFYELKIDPRSPLLRLNLSDLVPMKVLNQVLVRSVNEGFADFWGWAYSQDEHFVARSLGDRENGARRLDMKQEFLPQKNALRSNLIAFDRSGLPVLKSEAGRVNAAYRFGTEYARSLRGIVEALVEGGGLDRATAAAQVRTALAASLSDISQVVLRKWGREELDTEQMLRPTFIHLMKMDSGVISKTKMTSVVCGELDRVAASVALVDSLCSDVPPRAKAVSNSAAGRQR